ncbi:replication protein RepA, partial [Enterococcus faecium]|uniref:replication protein RepA n=1 Tax=Enterococcus faecium TaxID=1352 RepID=UPI003F51FCA0
MDGKPVLRSVGVPYGAYPRVALIYLLSQAVTKRSRDVYLGRNFTEWMRRLGYQTVSYGPRGT